MLTLFSSMILNILERRKSEDFGIDHFIFKETFSSNLAVGNRLVIEFMEVVINESTRFSGFSSLSSISSNGFERVTSSVKLVPKRDFNLDGVPIQRILPSFMIVSRSHKASHSSIICVVRTTARSPLRVVSDMTVHNCRRDAGSTPLDGSSENTKRTQKMNLKTKRYQ